MKKNENSIVSEDVKSYNLKGLAELYEVSPKTMTRWLIPHKKSIGKRTGYLYTPRQVRVIFEKLGDPPNS
ncbi:hypothetical protein [Dinghuibacter silviterrae]|uniref:hypothetical protein n=1 Tax=Dinghuibacter silviterrae TaxID=1539049 RepID=UPI00106416FD|nr:hypothetical protein [Dinghuibacter silviterrae]